MLSHALWQDELLSPSENLALKMGVQPAVRELTYFSYQQELLPS